MDFSLIGRKYLICPKGKCSLCGKASIMKCFKSNQSYSLKDSDCAIIKAFFMLARKDTKQTYLTHFNRYFLDM